MRKLRRDIKQHHPQKASETHLEAEQLGEIVNSRLSNFFGLQFLELCTGNCCARCEQQRCDGAHCCLMDRFASLFTTKDPQCRHDRDAKNVCFELRSRLDQATTCHTHTPLQRGCAPFTLGAHTNDAKPACQVPRLHSAAAAAGLIK